MKKRLVGVCFGSTFAILASLGGDARADTVITGTFTGHLDQVTDTPDGKLAAAGIVVGAPFSGSFRYDSSAAPDLTYEPASGNPADAWYNSLQSYSFTVQTANGSYTFGLVPGSITPNTLSVQDYRSGGISSFEVGTSGNGFATQSSIPADTVPSGYTQDWTVEFLLQDETGTALSGDALPTAFTLGNWATSHFVVFSTYYELSGRPTVTDFQIHGNVETLSPAPPAPAPAPAGSWSLWVLAAALLALLGAHRISPLRPLA